VRRSAPLAYRRAFNRTSRKRFPCASTVRPDLGERRVAQRFPPFADTEGVTGSNPVAPTNRPLTSGNAVTLTITALTQRTRWSGRWLGARCGAYVPDGERFPCLTFLFMDPWARTVTTPSDRGAAGRRLRARRGYQPGGRQPGHLEAFIGDLLARGTTSTAATYHTVLKIRYGWLAEEERRFRPTRSCPPTRHPQGRTSWRPGRP
jgi:hypothetical protein